MPATLRRLSPLRLASLCLACAGWLGGGESAASLPVQIPLCMVGDSITWAMEGDCWRQKLLQRLPRLAFIGTHSAKFGYSHAGEGGNGTGQVLARVPDIPPSPYYHLLIGTNNNAITDASAVEKTAEKTATSILAIVNGLLAKPGTRTVFLGSILPCTIDNPAKPANPLRDQTNAATNQLVRARLPGLHPAGQVVWVEYEQPLRAHAGWERLIRLHPTPAGYELLADLLAASLTTTLAIDAPLAVPVQTPGSGVWVDNLLDQASLTTRQPVIAGWYTLSCTVSALKGPAQITLVGKDSPFKAAFPLTATEAGTRIEREVMTGFENHGYKRDRLVVEVQGATISEVQFEKRRPSGHPSVYGDGRFLDRQSAWSPGEQLALPATSPESKP